MKLLVLLAQLESLNYNKTDLEEKRGAPEKEGEKFADEKGYPFFETSAKDNKNIEEIFKSMTWELTGAPKILDNGFDAKDGNSS